MEELNYILKQAKRFHYTNWDDSELKKCIDMLMDLTRQELITLYTSRWISHNKTLKEEIFKLLSYVIFIIRTKIILKLQRFAILMINTAYFISSFIS